jgi:hypothetical protein
MKGRKLFIKRVCHGATLNLVIGGNRVDVPGTGEALWSLRDESWSPLRSYCPAKLFLATIHHAPGSSIGFLGPMSG